MTFGTLTKKFVELDFAKYFFDSDIENTVTKRRGRNMALLLLGSTYFNINTSSSGSKLYITFNSKSLMSELSLTIFLPVPLAECPKNKELSIYMFGA